MLLLGALLSSIAGCTPGRGSRPSVYSRCASMISRTPSAMVAGVGVAPAICSIVIAMFVPFNYATVV